MDNRSESELEWFFTERAGDLGLRGQAYESDGGAVVWDDAKQHHAHMQRRMPRHRAAMAKESAVTPTVRMLSQEHFAIAQAGFATSGEWSSTLRSAFATKERRWPLVGVALMMPAAVELYAKAVEDKQCRSTTVLARFLDTVAHTYSRKLQPVQNQARDAYQAVVDTYEQLRVEREEKRRYERRQQLDAYFAGHSARLRGAL